MERHGGTVWAEGDVDAGCDIGFTLPLAAKASARDRGGMGTRAPNLLRLTLKNALTLRTLASLLKPVGPVPDSPACSGRAPPTQVRPGGNAITLLPHPVPHAAQSLLRFSALAVSVISTITFSPYQHGCQFVCGQDSNLTLDQTRFLQSFDATQAGGWQVLARIANSWLLKDASCWS